MKLIAAYKIILVLVTPPLFLAAVTSLHPEVGWNVKGICWGLFIGAAAAITQWDYIFPPSKTNEKEQQQ